MGGKAAILLVLGFSLIFLVVGHNFGSLSTRSVDNYADYYRETMAHNIAVSAANIAANQLFFDNEWKKGYENVKYQDGEFDVNVSGTLDDLTIEAVGRYEGISRRVEIKLRPSSYSKYGYYVKDFPGDLVLFTGDTISGPFHSQSKLNVKGSPVFMGKATAKNGLKLFKPADPKFYGGFESGVDVPLEWDSKLMEDAAKEGGFNLKDSAAGKFSDVRLIFNEDGSLTYQYKLKDKDKEDKKDKDKDKDDGEEDDGDKDKYEWGKKYTYDLSMLSSNGVIYLKEGNVLLSGKVAGKYTVGVGKDEGDKSGNIYIEDDIVYRTDPLDEDIVCQDMLGLVAANEVSVLQNAANNNDVNIHATMFNYKGGISVKDLKKNDPKMGRMLIVGGVIEKKSQITGYLSGNTLTAGYHQSIKYDPRLMLETPPYFPSTRQYEIVSWYE